MEKITSLNFSFDKVLIQLIIPGLICTFPWFLVFIHTHQNAKVYFQSNQSITLTTLLFISLIAGLLLENIGGRIEIGYFDKLQCKIDPNYNETWKKFLQLQYQGDEPIGHRYLRNILLRMKFELSAGLALIPMVVGFLFLDFYVEIFNNFWLTIGLLVIFPMSICWYLVFVEAKASSKILAETRKMLVHKYYVDTCH